MINIISSEIYKILKSRIFIVMSIILLFMFGTSVGSTLCYGEEIKQLSTGISKYIDIYNGDFAYYIILIFSVYTITAEYTYSTIRQMACRGISRWKLVLGQHIAIYVVITLILLIYGVLNLISWTMFNELGDFDLMRFITMNIGILCMFWSMTGIGIFISYLFKNAGISTAISMLFVLIGNYFLFFLTSLTGSDIFLEYSITNMREIVIYSMPEDAFKYLVVFILYGIIATIGSSLLFSKRDVD